MGPSVGFLQSLCLLSDAAAGFLAPRGAGGPGAPKLFCCSSSGRVSERLSVFGKCSFHAFGYCARISKLAFSESNSQ